MPRRNRTSKAATPPDNDPTSAPFPCRFWAVYRVLFDGREVARIHGGLGRGTINSVLRAGVTRMSNGDVRDVRLKGDDGTEVEVVLRQVKG